MIKLSDIRTVWELQRQTGFQKDVGLERELIRKLPMELNAHALVIAGIRRCGKSTLLEQLMRRAPEDVFFLNFDTPRLFRFELKDFELLDVLIDECGKKHLFFDEIQVVEGWELYVRQKLDEGYRLTITGSNASLLSRELGTKLTGRHVSKELFPFSFNEFLCFRMLEGGKESFEAYMQEGGFPEYLKMSNSDILLSLFDDIVYRDIAVRYGIRDVNSMKGLLLYLVANVGNLVTATKLSQMLGLKSRSTVLEYLSFFEQSYLLRLMPKFSYSYRSQLVNPRKVYFIDPAFAGQLSVSFGKDRGHLLENILYWELRRKGWNLYYWNEHNCECDFVACRENIPQKLIQVCYELNGDNEGREVNGLIDAMDSLKLEDAVIVTLNQKDIIRQQDRRINVVPVYEFLKVL